MSFEEDFDAFTDPDEHGTAVTIAGIAVNAIFDAEYVSVVFTGGVEVESVGPAVGFESALVPNVAQNDAVVVGSTNYEVKEVQPDGTGWTVLRLKATS